MEMLAIPCIIANSQEELDRNLSRVLGKVKRINLDVMDGKFVENTSLTFDFKLPSGAVYETHLMVVDPLIWVKKYGYKVELAIMQVEVLEDIGKAIESVKDQNVKVSLALNPETPVETVLPYIDQVDAFQIMTVHPGQYCVEFLPEPLEKIRRLRNLNENVNIEVDGCMNIEHIKMAKAAGANRFCSGSFILKSEDVWIKQ